jgi:hypothetical protein
MTQASWPSRRLCFLLVTGIGRLMEGKRDHSSPTWFIISNAWNLIRKNSWWFLIHQAIWGLWSISRTPGTYRQNISSQGLVEMIFYRYLFYLILDIFEIYRSIFGFNRNREVGGCLFNECHSFFGLRLNRPAVRWRFCRKNFTQRSCLEIPFKIADTVSIVPC